MSTKAQVEKRAAELGATLDWSDRTLHIDAPKGMVWGSTFNHTLVVPFANQSETWKGDAFDSAIQDMAMGLETCSATDCDICEEAL